MKKNRQSETKKEKAARIERQGTRRNEKAELVASRRGVEGRPYLTRGEVQAHSWRCGPSQVALKLAKAWDKLNRRDRKVIARGPGIDWLDAYVAALNKRRAKGTK